MNESCDRLAVARAAAAPGRRAYWVDDQPVPTPQAPAPTPVSESQKEQTPPEEAYPAPNTGSPIGDALEQNSRAATCAELALRRMEAGNPDAAWARPCTPPWPSWPTSGQSSNNSATTQANRKNKAGHKAVEEAPT